MDHADHVNFLRGAVTDPGGTWADVGAGRGAFTLALADLLGPSGSIVAIDREAAALADNRRSLEARFPQTSATYHVADFTLPLELPPLDGIVAANSLHFQRDQEAALLLLRDHLRPGGRLTVVEYNIERANGAVPYPLPFERFQRLAREAGFTGVTLLLRRPSRWHSEMYSAMATRPRSAV